MTLAKMGQKVDISFIRRAFNADGQEIFTHSSQSQPTVDAAAVASLVSMMKQTVLSGTARSITLNGFSILLREKQERPVIIGTPGLRDSLRIPQLWCGLVTITTPLIN